jgi:hypothetical protein
LLNCRLALPQGYLDYGFSTLSYGCEAVVRVVPRRRANAMVWCELAEGLRNWPSCGFQGVSTY